MFKLDLEKAEEPEIKLPTSVGSSQKQESRSWWWIGRPGLLQSMVLQSVGHNWVTELKVFNIHRLGPIDNVVQVFYVFYSFLLSYSISYWEWKWISPSVLINCFSWIQSVFASSFLGLCCEMCVCLFYSWLINPSFTKCLVCLWKQLCVKIYMSDASIITPNLLQLLFAWCTVIVPFLSTYLCYWV